MVDRGEVAESRSADHTELRDLLGLRGRAGWLFLAVLELTILLYMIRNFSVGEPIPSAIGLVLLMAAGIVVLLIPGDPLPWPATGYIVVAGPVAIALTTPEEVTGESGQTWTVFAASYVLAVLVLRNRMGAAWLGVGGAATVLGLLATFSTVAVRSLVASIVPVATVAGVSMCVVILRPTQRSLRLLQEEAALRAAAEAALAAESGERLRQLARLDKVARPMLERIARGAELTAADREQCRLLEAELRDGLRAPQLATNELAAAAREARARGVEVVLLDDGGFAAVSDQVRRQVIEVAVRELDAAESGSVTVRVLPVGRRIVATVLADTVATSRRTEIDAGGTVVVTT
ncbi:hypothetical protein [Nocardia paucivorans]|uniref:hypothetical protein n=1 Tax=Nocardia paucivorans TaxID=114259 RepID=UPI000312E56B|nr:hypothetical protein [Nocardia paucivorans]